MFNLNELEVTSNSIFHKFQQGNNPIRIVSNFIPDQVTFPDGKTTTKYNCWVIDRADGEVKMSSFSKSVILQLKTLVTNPEYAFTDLPPYDITVNKTGTGLSTVFTVTPARNNNILTEEETKKVFDAGSLKEFMEKLRSKKPSAEKPPETMTELDAFLKG